MTAALPSASRHLAAIEGAGWKREIAEERGRRSIDGAVEAGSDEAGPTSPIAIFLAFFHGFHDVHPSCSSCHIILVFRSSRAA